MQNMGFAGVQGVPLDRTVGQASSHAAFIGALVTFCYGECLLTLLSAAECMHAGNAVRMILLQNWLPCSRVAVLASLQVVMDVMCCLSWMSCAVYH